MDDNGTSAGAAADEVDDLDEREPDPTRERDDYLKYLFDGADTPQALAASLRAYADEVEHLAADGWQLAIPVTGGMAHLRRPQNP